MNSPLSTHSAESEASASQVIGQVSEQSASPKSIHTPQLCSESIGQTFQTSETSPRQTSALTQGQLFSLEGSHASHGVLPGSEEARGMTATSGRQCWQRFNQQGRLGLLVKMLLASSSWGSNWLLLTWSVQATPSSRLLFRLVPLGYRKLKAQGFGLWGRPMASDSKRAKIGVASLKNSYFRRLETRRQTPDNTFFAVVAREFSLLPSPKFVEAIMGYPENWTALDASEIPSSPRSRLKSSDQSQPSKGVK